MNCISGFDACRRLISAARRRQWLLLVGLIAVAACGVETSESADGPVERSYDVHYSVKPDPGSAAATITLQLRQSGRQVREIQFPSISAEMSNFHGDGDIESSVDSVRWSPPAEGGTLTWQVGIAHQRDNGGYDAWLGPTWGIFRAEDVIPRARTRTLKRSESNTTLSFELPPGWSAITEYSGIADPIRISRPERRFDQPTGWIAIGNLGVRRDKIAGVRVAVAGPEGQAVRRLDMIALLNWTLPELVEMLPEPMPRLTIVSAGDPMWRGGLSAPASLYIHAERPLISENATSSLLHEVMHTAFSLRPAAGMDWIIEGLAEYYSLELLRRGGAITGRRHATAVAEQAEWGSKAKNLCGASSTGATTARAVTLFRALDKELRDRTAGKANLDDVLIQLLSTESPADLATLVDITTKLGNERSDVLHIDNLPGCPRIAPGKQGSS